MSTNLPNLKQIGGGQNCCKNAKICVNLKLMLSVGQDGDREDKENQQGEGAYKRPIFSSGVAQKRIKEMNNEDNVRICQINRSFQQDNIPPYS